MGQCRGGHLKTRADPTFTTILVSIDLFLSPRRAVPDLRREIESRTDEGGPRQLETERDGNTRPAPFERRAPTAEYRARERTLAYISIPFTAPRRLGPRASNRDPPRFRRRFRFPSRSSPSSSIDPANIYIYMCVYVCIYIVTLRVIVPFTRSDNSISISISISTRVSARIFLPFLLYFPSHAGACDAEAARRRLVRAFLSPEEPLNGTKSGRTNEPREIGVIALVQVKSRASKRPIPLPSPFSPLSLSSLFLFALDPLCILFVYIRETNRVFVSSFLFLSR